MIPRRAYRGWDHDGWTGKTVTEPQTERIQPIPPAAWWIDTDAHGIPCLWTTCDGRRVVLDVSRALSPELWSFLCSLGIEDRRLQP